MVVAQIPTTEPSLRRSRLLWLMPSLADTFFLAVLLGAFVGYGSELFSRDGDTGRHLRLGEFMLSTLTIPTADLFSHTSQGLPFVPFEWLSQVLFALAYRLLDLYGVALVTSLVVALTLFILFRFMLRLEINYVVALALTVLAAAASSVHWLARPHVFTIPFVMVTYVLLELYQREGRRNLLALPALVAIWANIHGGFLVAFILLGVYLVGNILYALLATNDQARTHANGKVKTLSLVSLLSLLASLVNPSGLGQLPHLLGYLRLTYLVDLTLEYQSPDFHTGRMQVFLLLILLVIVTLGLSQRRPSIIHLASLAMMTFFALYSIRNIPIYAVVVTPIIGLQITRALEDLRESPEVVGWIRALIGRICSTSSNLTRIENLRRAPVFPIVAVVILVAAGLGLRNLGQMRTLDFPPNRFPASAVEFVKRESLQGKMFNELNWGGYLLFTLYPEHKVFIDGQTDFYGEALTREYATVANVLPGWETVLDEHDVDWILFPTQSPLSWTLAKHPTWSAVYRDRTATVFVRTGTTSSNQVTTITDPGDPL